MVFENRINATRTRHNPGRPRRRTEFTAYPTFRTKPPSTPTAWVGASECTRNAAHVALP
jgi:hypothetical protein